MYTSDLYDKYEEFDVPNQKIYATKMYRSTGPELKFQTAGQAKKSLAYTKTYNDLGPIKIYKQQGDKFVIIFNSESITANQYRSGQLTYQQLLSRIFS